ncbi:MAG: hypothetical protein AB4080_14170 [Trichodesmium sp.]
MENQEKSSKVLNNPQSQLKLLQIAEYSALGAAFFGSVLAWLFEQVLFAATPITLALTLNTINRKIFEEKIQKQTNHANHEVEELRVDLNSVFQYLDKLPTINAQEAAKLPVNFSENQSSFEYNTITKEDWEVINIKFAEIDEELQSLKDFTANLQENLGDNSGDNLQSNNNPDIPNKIENLQRQITKLEELNRDIVRPYFIRLIRAVKQLEKTDKN